MTKSELIANIKRKQTFLCVGLDTDITKIPECLFTETEDPIFEFNKRIIDATADLCVAYKPNVAFYEAMGAQGIEILDRTVDYIRTNYPDQFIIADAKRGDIGNTSKLYARAFFDTMDFDAITVAPYMGSDSVTPFLDHPGKWVILLSLTSNQGAFDFQLLEDPNGERFFEKVLKTSKQWANEEQMMYVVGATKANMLSDVRMIVPDSFLLVPGVGAQGGSLSDVAKYGMNKDCGLLVNSSRAIIYASTEPDFAEKAREAAQVLQTEMAQLLQQYC